MDPCAALAATALFRGAAASDFEPLAPHMVERLYPRGSYICRAGETAVSAYLITAGEIAAYRLSPDGDEFLVEVHVAGEVFGQLPMWDVRPVRLLDAVASVPTRCIVFPLDELRRLMEKQPLLLISMARAYSMWLRYRDAQDSETAFQNLSGKVASKLLELHALTGTPNGAPIPIDLPQTKLAAMLGASRENVNRALARLIARGDVQKLGRRLMITNSVELANRYRWTSADGPVLAPR